MSPLEDECGNDDVEMEGEVSMDLDLAEIEELERLIYGCRMVEFKKEKIFVDVRADKNFISFRGTNAANAVSISFDFNKETRRIMNLTGVDMEWVRTFLRKYRIIED
ncbi:MAG: hypothetical protein NTZ25_04270 [Candidatus Peregrinibacteria bacterium]|nr:hypothetical protein [Candidatus Peregrinibacteria bacterium]